MYDANARGKLMAARAMHVCGQCPALVPAGLGDCPAHRKAWQKGPGVPTSRGWGWSRVRAQVLAEEPLCRTCGAPAFCVDHIVNRARGGTDARENLQGLCTSCSDAKTQWEAAEGQRRRPGG